MGGGGGRDGGGKGHHSEIAKQKYTRTCMTSITNCSGLANCPTISQA